MKKNSRVNTVRNDREHQIHIQASTDEEQVRGILRAVSEFIIDLKEPLKEMLDAMVNVLEGKKLGEEVAVFYKKLKEAGMPEDMVREMTKEFLEKKLETAPSVGSLISKLQNVIEEIEVTRKRRPERREKTVEALETTRHMKTEKTEKALGDQPDEEKKREY